MYENLNNIYGTSGINCCAGWSRKRKEVEGKEAGKDAGQVTKP